MSGVDERSVEVRIAVVVVVVDGFDGKAAECTFSCGIGSGMLLRGFTPMSEVFSYEAEVCRTSSSGIDFALVFEIDPHELSVTTARRFVLFFFGRILGWMVAPASDRSDNCACVCATLLRMSSDAAQETASSSVDTDDVNVDTDIVSSSLAGMALTDDVYIVQSERWR